MTRSNTISNRVVIAATIYLAVIVVSIGAAWVALMLLGETFVSERAAENMLAQLEGRSVRVANDSAAGFTNAPTGSPFLQGKTQTVAGAALLQRVAAAVKRTDGNILSSQVNLQESNSKDGWIGLTVSCDIEEARLQSLLYDIEAGMPFLFIDQLSVQGPTGGVEDSHLHVVLGISGQWLGTSQ
jgi:general secretion pathway protein M